MKLNRCNTLGLETIARQTDDIKGKIIPIIEDLREKKIDEGGFCTRLAKTLADRFGLSIEIVILDMLFENAYATINTYVKSNPLYSPYLVDVIRKSPLVDSKNIITANIDLKKAYISGSIQKYQHKIELTKGLLYASGDIEGEYSLSAAEVTAIILHEMGHLFTFIEYLLYSTKISTVILTRTQDILGRDEKARLKLINDDEELKNIPASIKADIASATKKESIEVAIVKGKIEEINSFAGMDFYSTRYFEQAADLFSARCGCGTEIATGFGKLVPRSPTKLMNVIGDIVLGVFSLGMFPLLGAITLGTVYQGDVYDDPYSRFMFIKREYVNSLKTAKTKEEKVAIIKNIEKVQEIIDYVRKTPRVIGWYFAYMFSKKYRKYVKDETAMKQIEEMIDNDLYTLGEKLKV
jgi:hypothetical protein